MEEQERRQPGDGQGNYGDAARHAARAAKELGKAAAEKGAEAAGNATTAVVQGSTEAGKAAAGVATGAAAGGPWGAILSALWALRKPLYKLLISLGLVLLFIIVLVVSLPSIITNNQIQLDPSTVDPNGPTDLMEMADDMSDLVAGCIQGGYDAALAEVERIIEANGYDYEASMEALINHGSASPEYDVAYVFAAYSASMGQRGTSPADMKRKLDAVAGDMFRVTYEEKQFERVIPLSYATYAEISVTVVTDKKKIGEVNGSPRYQYTTAQRTYYYPIGEAATEEDIQQPQYTEVTVDVPIYRNGAITGTREATYYEMGELETLTPQTELVTYAEATIHPFDQGVILKAFDVDPNAQYNQFQGTTYATAIETMANALKLTLYGATAVGEIPALTDSELSGIVSGITSGDARKRLVETGLSLVGRVPYFWGGKSRAGWNDEWNTPKKVTSSGSVTTGSIRPYGLDCSGFTDWVYKTALGTSIGTGSASQWSKSYEISEAELLPGDLGFKAKPSDPGTNHVLMYVGTDENGDKLWVHSSSAKGGVVLNSPSYVKYYRRPSGVDYSASVGGGSAGSLGEPLYTLRVNVTHYCACAKCCGDSADGITASGKLVAPGMVAMSSYYPFGTLLEINGELYTVEDRGGSKIEKDTSRVDIFVADHKEALRLGRYWAEAKIYRLGR